MPKEYTLTPVVTHVHQSVKKAKTGALINKRTSVASPHIGQSVHEWGSGEKGPKVRNAIGRRSSEKKKKGGQEDH
jgi:hypothetical protein